MLQLYSSPAEAPAREGGEEQGEPHPGEAQEEWLMWGSPGNLPEEPQPVGPQLEEPQPRELQPGELQPVECKHEELQRGWGSIVLRSFNQGKPPPREPHPGKY